MVCLIHLVGHLWTRSGRLWASHSVSAYIGVCVHGDAPHTEENQ